MAWIKIEQSLLTHRKTMAVADELEITEIEVVGHLVSLWAWALDSAPDGDLSVPNRTIAVAARWPGAAAHFVDALIFAGFIDDDYQGKRALHNWNLYTGRLMERRALNRERQRRYRKNSSQNDTF